MRIALSLWLLSCVFLIGCADSQRREPPQPEIKVERSETASSAYVKVIYENHDTGHRDGTRHVVLDTPEKLRHYKKQVMFLLSQLEETEKRMQVSEQESKK